VNGITGKGESLFMASDPSPEFMYEVLNHFRDSDDKLSVFYYEANPLYFTNPETGRGQMPDPILQKSNPLRPVK
jgi:hypothetical protein